MSYCSDQTQGLLGRFRKGKPLGRLDLGREVHPTGFGWELEARGQASGL